MSADKTTKKAPAKKADKAEVSLEEQLVQKQTDLLEAKKSHRAGELVNPRVITGYRKDVARILSSDARDKTITVSVTSRETHPIYKKQYSVTRKYQAHDEKNEAKLGDKVQIAESRPISKTKSFILQHIEERAHGTVELKDEVTEVVPEKAEEK